MLLVVAVPIHVHIAGNRQPLILACQHPMWPGTIQRPSRDLFPHMSHECWALPWGLKPRPGPLPIPLHPSDQKVLDYREGCKTHQGSQEPPSLRWAPQVGLKAFDKSLVLPLPLHLLKGLRAESWTLESSLSRCSTSPSWPHGLQEA